MARNGSTAEVTIDDVSVMDALRVVEEFVEVEVELKQGKPKQLEAIADELEHAGARPTDGTPKLFRVLRLPVDDHAPTGPLDALRMRLRAQLRTVLANDPGTRLGRDPESLHDMRVAVRRSRALLRAGEPLYANDVSGLAEELRWVGEKLGAVRDLDVLLERLRAEAEDLDAADRTAVSHAAADARAPAHERAHGAAEGARQRPVLRAARSLRRGGRRAHAQRCRHHARRSR